MAPKKQLNSKKTNESSNDQIINSEIPNSKFETLELLTIDFSPFVPQEIRRGKFTDSDLEELSNSIKLQGLINPITVRPNSETERYEIICGERRYRAAQKAGMEAIPSIIRELSDVDALDIQLQENLQRKDIDPLEEAFYYKYLIEEKGYSPKDLSLKFSKNEKFIRLRLLLNDLIPEALEDVAAGHLPLGHAVELAKLSVETQSEALKLAYGSNWNGELRAHVPDKTDCRSLREFLDEVEDEIFHSLDNADFDKKDPRLHPTGLICGKCPERTGAKDSLFDLGDSKNDCCLNIVCFERKKLRTIQLKRDELSELAITGGKPAGYKIPLFVQYESHVEEEAEKWGEEVLYVSTPGISHNAKCKNNETGLMVDDTWRKGQTITICRSQECKHSSSSSSSGSTTDDAAEQKKKAKRKQEIFDVKIGEEVRKKVLAEAAKNFTAEKWIYESDNWRSALVARFLQKVDDHARNTIEEVLGKTKYSLNFFGYGASIETKIKLVNQKLTADEQSKVLFLCIIANVGEMPYGTWSDQKEILKIAEEFEVDYKKLDASERLLKSPKKYMSLAQDYFNAVERGEKPERPNFYK